LNQAARYQRARSETLIQINNGAITERLLIADSRVFANGSNNRVVSSFSLYSECLLLHLFNPPNPANNIIITHTIFSLFEQAPELISRVILSV